MTAEDPTYALGRTAEEHRRLEQQAALFRPITERFFRAAGVGPGMRVLDVGSGAGDVAFLAAELVGPAGEVVGVDADGSALRTARERARLLGLSNVTFLEGDIRTADPGRDFDAAVGRLVLLYFADPVEALAAILAHVRKGGLVAFQEVDMDPAITSVSYPEDSLWTETGKTIVRVFEGAGVHLRMGRKLLQTFLRAGLSVPALMVESATGAGPDFLGYAWLADTLRSLTPLAEKLGIANAADLGLDSLADRLREEAVSRELMVWTGPLVGASARKS